MFGILTGGNYYFHPSQENEWSKIQDQDRNTCITADQWYGWYSPYEYLYIYLYHGKSYNIRNVKIFLKTHGNDQDMTLIASFPNWPYSKSMQFQQLPEEIDIPILSEASYLYIYIIKHKLQEINISLCDVEMYGCGSNHTGDSCEPCDTVHQCTQCNVIDGSCDRCLPGLSGARCQNRRSNVAYKRKAQIYSYTHSLYFWNGFWAYNPNLTDGNVATCIEVEGRIGSVWMYFYLENTYNISRINMILSKIIKGDANMTDYSIGLQVYNYTTGRYKNHTNFPNSNSIPDVIRLPVTQTAVHVQIHISIASTSDVWQNKTIFQICEVEVYGCKDDSCTFCDIENCDICDDNGTVCQECRDGFTSPASNCTEECHLGTFGRNCSQKCGACSNNTCHHVTGLCGNGCQTGWAGERCNVVCPSGRYGDSCGQQCSSHCKTPSVCNHVNGTCEDGCQYGWINDKCNQMNTSLCVDWVPGHVQVQYDRMYWETNSVLTYGKNITRHDPAVGLICKFPPHDDETLYYDIKWFIENEDIFFNQTVQNTTKSQAVLKAHHMISANKKAGTTIHCAVGAKRALHQKPCQTMESSRFFAGIKISSQHITLERKGTEHLGLEMTIPYAAETLEIDGVEQPVSDLNVFVTVPGYNPSDCRGGISIRECEVKIKGYKFSEREKYDTEEWKQNHTFPVYSHDTDGYVINDRMTIRLETGGTNGVGSQIFSKLDLGSVQVDIMETETHWKGKSCSVRTDPHMYSFDGKSYECQIDGEFVLYRSEKNLQEIQTKHHLCSKGYDGPRCVCAVAFRAGRDVFIFDMCEGTEFIKYTICEDNAIQVKKVGDKNYKVYFPTGTVVSLYMMEWPKGHYNIDIVITPSLSDVGNTKGLCGTLDNNRNNDFLRRDATIDNINQVYPDDFSRSWQIQDNENLFVKDPVVYGKLSSVSTIRVKQCTCVNAQSHCSYNTFTPCSSRAGKNVPCSTLINNTRRKRDTTPYILRRKRSVPTNVTTYDEARAKCNAAFDESAAYSTCQQYVADLTNTSVENCILDVMMTGDDNITVIHVEAALQQCTTFVQLNATLQEAEPAVTYQIITLCPNNCSDHGYCNEGNCSCHTGYAGSDCSFDLLGPPSISDVPTLCDSSSEDCSAITITGKYFLENMATSCYLTIHQKNINNSLLKTDELKTDLQERTLFEGYCPITYEVEKNAWFTEVNLNISNDDIRFTNNYKVLIYQSRCQDVQNETEAVHVNLKNQYCFISTSCVKHDNTSTNDTCLHCDSYNDQFDWSVNNECISTSTEPEPTSSEQSKTTVAAETTTEGESITKEDTTTRTESVTEIQSTFIFEQTTTGSQITKEASSTIIETAVVESTSTGEQPNSVETVGSETSTYVETTSTLKETETTATTKLIQNQGTSTALDTSIEQTTITELKDTTTETDLSSTEATRVLSLALAISGSVTGFLIIAITVVIVLICKSSTNKSKAPRYLERPSWVDWFDSSDYVKDHNIRSNGKSRVNQDWMDSSLSDGNSANGSRAFIAHAKLHDFKK